MERKLIPQTKEQLAQYFDHTLLDCMATAADIRRICEEAIQYKFFGVCIHPRWVSLCADILHGTGVKVVTVAGFPFGTNLAKTTAFEAEAAIMDGADEVDIVADMASILEGDIGYLNRQFSSTMKVCRKMNPPVVLKVIIESAALNEEQIRYVCAIAQQNGVDFVKNSGAFYMFPRLSKEKFHIADDRRFARDLLLAKHILVVPGSGFDYPEPDHFRLVLLPEASVLKKAMEDLGDFLDGYHQ